MLMECLKVDLSKTQSPLLQPGTVIEVYRRLSLWCQQAPDGMARVNYSSSFAKAQVMDLLRLSLKEKGIRLLEISLQVLENERELIQSVIEQIRSLKEGVVSLDAISIQNGEAILQQLDLFREQIALPDIRQIWWIHPLMVNYLISRFPDLDSWFIWKLNLNEKNQNSIDEAIHRSNVVLSRLRQAQVNGSKRYQLALLAHLVVDILQQAGATQLAKQRAEELLEDVDVSESFGEYNSVIVQALLAIADLYDVLGDHKKAIQISQRIALEAPELWDPKQITKIRHSDIFGYEYGFSESIR